MILFKGHMGTILHTGDFRFSQAHLNSNILFPTQKLHIDVLHLDNTFCDPEFIFLNYPELLKELEELPPPTPEKPYIFPIDNLGKEDVLLNL